MKRKRIQHLAEDPNIPPEHLEELAKSEDRSVLCKVARNEKTPIYILEKLADWTPEYNEYDDDLQNYVAASVAANPATPIFLLEKLSRHRDSFVIEQVAKNPNTPLNTLSQLAQTQSSSILIALTENSNIPVSLLETIAANKNKRVRQAVIKHPRASDSVHDVIKFVEDGTNVKASTLKKLARHHQLKIRQMVAQHINTPTDALKILANEDDYKILDLVTIHPNTTIAILENLTKRLTKHARVNKWIERVSSHSKVLSKAYINLIENPDISLKIQLELLDEHLKHGKHLKDFAQSKKVSSQILERLAEYEAEWLKVLFLWSILLSNPRTPENAIYEIYEDLHQCKEQSHRIAIAGIRESIYRHPNTPQTIRQDLAKLVDKRKRKSQKPIAIDAQTSVSTLRQLANSEEWNAHEAVMNNKNTPTDILEKFARHENRDERLTLARRENLPFHIWEILAKDENIYVRVNLARNNTIPEQISRQLTRDNATEVREGISRNPTISNDVLSLLSKDNAVSVRLNVVKHPNTDYNTLLEMVGDKQNKIIFALLERTINQESNPPVQLLDKLFSANYPVSILLRIAEHPYTPPLWLEKLAFTTPETINNDYPIELNQEKYTQAMQIYVAGNKNAAMDTLEKLASSSDEKIKERAKKTLASKFKVMPTN